MNADHKKQYITFQIAKAKKILAEVDFLIENGFYENAANRLYYACYYAVAALLLTKDIKTKTHKGVILMFGLHYINTGIIDKYSGDLFSRIFDLRQDTDYEFMFEVKKEQVIVLIEPAKRLVKQIETILLQNQ